MHDMEDSQSARTVIVALSVNLAIAVAKLVAAVLSRSTAMFAEAAHSFADSGNEVLLMVAQARSSRPPDERHPLGHGREAYFWALIASVSVFVAGALYSVREGVAQLFDAAEARTFVIAYVVLGISLVLEAISLTQAYRQLHQEAAHLSRNFVEHLVLTSDPTARAVFGEDAAAVAGDIVAIAGVALHQVTGSSIADALAAVVIGLILGAVAIELARRNRDFLLGEQAPASVRHEVCELIAGQPGVVTVEELVISFIGPRRLWVICRLDIDDAMAGDQVEELVRSTERVLHGYSPFIVRADVVTTGALQPDQLTVRS
jgi:cation diffusion facilitator family transporter